MLSLIIFSAALFVDGATDCANSVTGAVSSGAMSLKRSVILSAVLSFLGCLIFCLFCPSVAESSAAALAFPEGREILGVCVSLLSVVIWSGAAWYLGLPTSEGHALICAAAGAAAALGGKVYLWDLLFLILSIFPAAALGVIFSLVLAKVFKKKVENSLRFPIILSSALSSFYHGAQDGQKFWALALSASLLSEKNSLPAVIVFSLSMGIGTLFGKRIIEKMGCEMAAADKRSALSSDLGSALALSILTALGIPASTTHLKMTSLIATTKLLGGRTDKATFILLAAAWIATFPISFALSFLITKGIFIILL